MLNSSDPIGRIASGSSIDKDEFYSVGDTATELLLSVRNLAADLSATSIRVT